MKKLFLSAFLMLCLVCLLAVCVSAATYTVNYDNKTKATTDENGQITLRDTAVSALKADEFTVKDANNNDTVTKQQFLGWFTEDGRVFAPGETITLTEDVYLYQASGITVYNFNDLNANLGKGWWYIKLGADITATSQISTNRTGNGTTSILDLNGFSVTSSAKDAFGSARSGLMIVGKGTITHTGAGSLFIASQHGYGDGDQKTYVGEDVTVVTGGSVFYAHGDFTYTDIPKVKIWGTVTAKNIASVATIQNAWIVLGDGADITLSGPSLIESRGNATAIMFDVKIGDAKITTPESFSWFDDITRYEFTITGGSFTAAPVLGMLTNGYSAVLNEETGYYEVSGFSCPLGEHNYVEAELYGEDIFCDEGRFHYFRCACGDYYVDNVSPMGHNYTITTIDKEASVTELGIKRVTCDRCAHYYTYEYSVSPLTLELQITVVDGEGTKVITVLAQDLYNMTISETTNGFVARIDSIKDVVIGDVTYTKNDIVVAYIPSGVNGIAANTFKDMSSLKEVIVMDRANVSFVKSTFVNCPALEKLTAGDCDLTFPSGVNENTSANVFINCPNLTVLDLTNASATFNKFAFASNKTIKHVIMGAGNTYVFMTDSFRHSVLDEVIIPDNSNVTLHQKCFAETETIKYVYIGANAIASKSIGDDTTHKSIFGGNSYLEKVVLIDIEYIGQWSLSTKKPGNLYQPLCNLEVYAHSENFHFHAEAFNDRAGNYVVSIYSANPNITSVTASSKYVIYKGIGHAFTTGVITPSTCVTNGVGGYVTTCPCGIDYLDNRYTTVSNVNNDLNGVEHEPFGRDTFELELLDEHTPSNLIKDVNFANGYTALGIITYKCLYCDEATETEDEASYPALFECLGYSFSEIAGGIAMGFSKNEIAFDEYLAVTGADIQYGLFAVVHDRIGTNEAIDADGTAANGVLAIPLSEDGYQFFEIFIVNFETDVQKSAEIVFGSYVIETKGGRKFVSYIQPSAPIAGEKYSHISYNSLATNSN